jgi:hypothetical protein
MAFFAAQSTQNNHVEVKAVVPWPPTLPMASPFVSTLKLENQSRVKPWRTHRPNWGRTRRLRGKRGQQKVSTWGFTLTPSQQVQSSGSVFGTPNRLIEACVRGTVVKFREINSSLVQ